MFLSIHLFSLPKDPSTPAIQRQQKRPAPEITSRRESAPLRSDQSRHIPLLVTRQSKNPSSKDPLLLDAKRRAERSFSKQRPINHRRPRLSFLRLFPAPHAAVALHWKFKPSTSSNLNHKIATQPNCIALFIAYLIGPGSHE